MNIKRVGVWAITIFVALIFVMSGLNKLTAAAAWQARFIDQWGLPGWMAGATAVAEIVGAVLLIRPKTAVFGGSIIAVVMLGATGTHIMAGEYSRLGVTIVFGAMAAFVAYYHCPCCSPISVASSSTERSKSR